MTRPLLEPGRTCATLVDPPRSGVLVDGHDFYRAVYDACLAAKRTILMTGWQFASGVELVRGDEAAGCGHPTELLAFLKELCEQRPELEVYLLAWDASAVFTFEREPLQKLRFWRKGHERIHYEMDNAHPVGASHHQKLIVVDRGIAFVGGMDVCTSRWDRREHAAASAERARSPWGSYAPYHDVQAFVGADTARACAAIDILRGWFCERWLGATGTPLVLPDVAPAAIAITPSFVVEAPRVGLTRTLPAQDEPPTELVKEIYELHLRAIAEAQRLIYIENQYFSSNELGDAFVRRMTSDGPPLEIAIVLPDKSAGWKERISIGAYQQRILARLTEVAARTGHRLGVYYQCAPADDGEVPVFVHAKVLAVDDRFLLVSSANTSNRSMTFDSELGLAWEAPAPTVSLRDARIELLREHCGMSDAEALRELTEITGLVDRLDALATARSHRLRMHRRNVDEKPGWLLSKLLPSESPMDPDHSMVEELLPEGGSLLDRLLRDPLMLISNRGRIAGRKLRRAIRR